MNSLQIKRNQATQPKPKLFQFGPLPILKKYRAYAAAQEKLGIYWYLKAVIVIPCCIMVPSIILMEMSTPNFVWFIGLSMILFFSNIMVHIAEFKSTVTVPVYHLSIAIMLIIPIISYFLNL